MITIKVRVSVRRLFFFRRQSFISLLTKTYRTRSNLVWKNIDDNGGKYELVT